jgi:tetratricopeptide (TPR) repeat protein
VLATRRQTGPRERQRLARRIRELRTARGLTQASLAGSEFTKGYVSQLETGRVGLSLRAAQVFAQRLGVPLSDLVRAPDEAERVTELSLLEAERELAQGSAERAFQLAAKIPRNDRLRGRVLRLHGRALLALDRAAEAIAALEQALDAFRAEQDRESYVRTQYDIAYAHARLDRPQQALALLLQCEQAFRSGDIVDRTFEFEVEAFLASAYARIGDAQASEPHIDRAQALAQDIVDHDALAAMYGRLAGIEQQRGQFERALQLWRACLRELDLAGRERLVADVWHNLAATHLRLGQHAKARTALSRAEQLQSETGHARLRAWIKLTRAKLAMEERTFGDAERLAREAATDASATGLARGEALLVVAQVLARRKVPVAKVSQAFGAALAAMKDEPVGSRMRALKLYSDALAGSGDLAGALARAREALELARPGW